MLYLHLREQLVLCRDFLRKFYQTNFNRMKVRVRRFGVRQEGFVFVTYSSYLVFNKFYAFLIAGDRFDALVRQV